MQALVSIVGPTASGKSAIAVALGKRFGAPVVSADSVQMYRGLDVGSGKIQPSEMQGVPHYMLDVMEPDEEFSAADYAAKAEILISQLHENHPLVILAGGSGFYLQALLQGLDDMPAIPAAVRAAVRADFEQLGLAPLLLELERADPVTFAQIDRNNPVRVCRALEVYRASGKPVSAFRKGIGNAQKPYRSLMIGLSLEREALNARIDARVDAMLAQGWLAEVDALLTRYPPDCPALASLGYRELVAYRQGKASWPETVEWIKVHTRQFAKRQMTWFKRFPEIIWFKPEDEIAIGDRVERFLNP